MITFRKYITLIKIDTSLQHFDDANVCFIFVTCFIKTKQGKIKFKNWNTTYAKAENIYQNVVSTYLGILLHFKREDIISAN